MTSASRFCRLSWGPGNVPCGCSVISLKIILVWTWCHCCRWKLEWLMICVGVVFMDPVFQCRFPHSRGDSATSSANHAASPSLRVSTCVCLVPGLEHSPHRLAKISGEHLFLLYWHFVSPELKPQEENSSIIRSLLLGHYEGWSSLGKKADRIWLCKEDIIGVSSRWQLARWSFYWCPTMHNTHVLAFEDCITVPSCIEPNSIGIDASPEESFGLWFRAQGSLLIDTDLGNTPSKSWDVALFALCFE